MTNQRPLENAACLGTPHNSPWLTSLGHIPAQENLKCTRITTMMSSSSRTALFIHCPCPYKVMFSYTSYFSLNQILCRMTKQAYLSKTHCSIISSVNYGKLSCHMYDMCLCSCYIKWLMRYNSVSVYCMSVSWGYTSTRRGNNLWLRQKPKV